MIRPLALLRLVVPLVILVGASTASAVAQHTQEVFPARERSGTAWLPDETPMDGVPRTVGKWEVMLHGTVFGQFLDEPTRSIVPEGSAASRSAV
jgi:hypothetical protein